MFRRTDNAKASSTTQPRRHTPNAQSDGIYQHAASLFSRCRAAGRSVRATVDCRSAAIAIERDVEVLAHDRDFEIICDVCGLRLLVS